MIFVHDHTFIKKGDRYYTSGTLNNKLFERYTKCFEKVTVFASVRLASDMDDRFIREENVVDCVHLNFVFKTNNILSLFANRKKIEKAVSQHSYVVARMPSIYGLMGVKYSIKLNKPYLIELVGCPWDAMWNHSLIGKLIAPIIWYKTKKIVKSAPYVLYVTNDYLQNKYPSMGKTISCSDVVLPTLNESALEARLHKIKQMTNHKRIVLGTIAAVDVRYKGQEYVIKAIAELNRQGYNFEYRIVGGGNKAHLQSIAEKYRVTDRVIFEGSIPHEKVFDYLDNIDIYLQPSQTEGLPRALIEAMSRGCPCIGSNAGGIPELLDNAYVFCRGNVKELATILANFDTEKMLEQAKRNFELSKRYAKEVIETRRNKFLQDFVESVKDRD